MIRSNAMYKAGDEFIVVSNNVIDNAKRKVGFGSYIKVRNITQTSVTCRSFSDARAVKTSNYNAEFDITKDTFDAQLQKGSFIEHAEKQSRWKKPDANIAAFNNEQRAYAITCLPLHLNVTKLNAQTASTQYFPAQTVVKVARFGDKLFVCPDTRGDADITRFIAREILARDEALKASFVVQNAQEIKSLDAMAFEYSHDYDDKNANVEVKYSSGLVEYYVNDKFLKSDVKKK